jgi:hypothetical protein
MSPPIPFGSVFRFALTLTVAVVALAGQLVFAPDRVAAACSGTSCNGQDPGAAGCTSGAYTVYSASKQFYSSANFWATVRVELRWSPTCKTNWAKATITSSNPSAYSFQIQVLLKDANSNTLWHTEYTGIGRAVYGDMHYAPTQRVKACAHINNFSGPFVCTSLG